MLATVAGETLNHVRGSNRIFTTTNAFQPLLLFSALHVCLNLALKNVTAKVASLHSEMRQASQEEEVKGIQTKDTQKPECQSARCAASVGCSLLAVPSAPCCL